MKKNYFFNFFALAFTVAAASFWLGKYSAATNLVTNDEINTVEVVSKSIKAVVKVVARIPRDQLREGESPEEIGSGFFYKYNTIVTNYHVVDNAEGIQVELYDKRKVGAEVVAADRGLDIALLKVSGIQAPATLTFANSNNVVIGQKVVALGSPLGIRNFVSTGVLSNIDRTEAPGDNFGQEISQMLMTSALILVGNSGGPLLNSRGQVIGVNDAVLQTNTFAADGTIGLAIPSKAVQESIQDLERFGVSQRGSLEVVMSNLGDIEPIIRKQAGIISTDGAIVETVPPDSLGKKAGLRGSSRNAQGQLLALGDVIVAIDGTRVKDLYDVVRLVASKRVGEKVNIKVWRNRKEVNLTVVLTKRNSNMDF